MKIERLLVSLAVSGAAALTAYAQAPQTPTSSVRTTRPVKNFVTVTDQTIRATKADDCSNYQAGGYTALDQINKRNVRTLQLVWSPAMQPGVNQATPLVYGGVMYLGNPGDVIQARDSRVRTRDTARCATAGSPLPPTQYDQDGCDDAWTRPVVDADSDAAHVDPEAAREGQDGRQRQPRSDRPIDQSHVTRHAAFFNGHRPRCPARIAPSGW